MYILYKIFCYGYNNYNFLLTPFRRALGSFCPAWVLVGR